MNHCPENPRIQDWLDGLLDTAARTAFEAHLSLCAECEREVAVYRRVFASLESLPLLAPSAALEDRIMARAFPAPVSSRWMQVLGLAYGGTLAVSLVALGSSLLLPAPRRLAQGLAAAAARAVVESLVFVVTACNDAALRMGDLLHWVGSGSARSTPVARAMGLFLEQPTVMGTVGLAVAACVALLWWMRSRGDSVGGMRNVGLLGF